MVPYHTVATRAQRIGRLRASALAVMISIGMLVYFAPNSVAMPTLTPAYSINPCGGPGSSSTVYEYGTFSAGSYSYSTSTGTVEILGQGASATAGASGILSQGGTVVAPPNTANCYQHGSTAKTVSIVLSGTWVAYPYLKVSCDTGTANASYYVNASADAWDSSGGSYEYGQYHENTTVAFHAVTCSGSGTVIYNPSSVSGTWSVTLPSFNMVAYSWWSFYVGLGANNSANAGVTGITFADSQLLPSGTPGGYGAQVIVTSVYCSLCY
jgi:hypothetical protein